MPRKKLAPVHPGEILGEEFLEPLALTRDKAHPRRRDSAKDRLASEMRRRYAAIAPLEAWHARWDGAEEYYFGQRPSAHVVRSHLRLPRDRGPISARFEQAKLWEPITPLSLQLLQLAVPMQSVQLIPVTDSEYTEFASQQIVEYARQLERAGEATANDSFAVSRERLADLSADRLRAAGHVFFVARSTLDGARVGWVWLSPAPEFLGPGHKGSRWLSQITVDEPLRRRGWGRAILIAIERHLVAVDVRQLWLRVFDWNTAARALYDSLGYELVRRFPSDAHLRKKLGRSRDMLTDRANNMRIRQLAPGDEAQLEAFLVAHRHSSRFLRGNVRRAGLEYQGKPFQAIYAGAFRQNEMVGVVAHSWSGMLLIQAPELARELGRACVDWSQRPVTGLTGPRAHVGQVSAALEIDVLHAKFHGDEWLYALDLAELVVPTALSTGSLVCRAPNASERDTLCAWRLAYDMGPWVPTIRSRVDNAQPVFWTHRSPTKTPGLPFSTAWPSRCPR